MSSLRDAYGRVAFTELGILVRDMSIDGTVGATVNAAVDGSITPVEFWVQPLPGREFELAAIDIIIADSGVAALTDYGVTTGPLTNGLKFFTELDGVRVDFATIIKSNLDLIGLGPDTTQVPFLGSVSVSTYGFNAFDIAKAGVILNGNTDDKLGVIIRDDLSSLISQTFAIKGNVRLKSVA